MITNHQPLSASLAASFAIHHPFSPFDALKPPHPFLLRAPAYRPRVTFRYPSFSFFVFQSNSDPPNHQRLGAVHLFVTPRSLLSSCEPDPCPADRPFHSSNVRIEYPFLPPSRLSTKYQVVSIILTQTTAPNSRSSLIHQLLGVTLVVAAVLLQHKSVTGAFV